MKDKKNENIIDENSYSLPEIVGMGDFIAPESVACNVILSKLPPSKDKPKTSDMGKLYLCQNEKGDVYFTTPFGSLYRFRSGVDKK